MKKLLNSIQKDLAFSLMLKVRTGEMDSKKAQEIAKEFLAFVLANTEKELFEKMFVLGKDYSEILELYVKYALPFYEKERQRLILRVHEYLQKGNMSDAYTALKGGEIT